VWLLLLLASAAGCGGGAVEPQPSSVKRVPTAGSTDVPLLRDGRLAPGTYRYVHRIVCDDPPRDCPAGATPPPALGIELTVPDGWTADTGFNMVSAADGREPDAPANAALIVGWTSFWVGLSSEPCAQVGHQRTDIEVGPSVDDFVDAVVAHPSLDVTEPVDVTLQGHRGAFFTLTGPPDISECVEWRPWDPGFFAQGPNNIWDVWVMDVEGQRILLVASRFQKTPPDVSAELRQIVDSIRFGAV